MKKLVLAGLTLTLASLAHADSQTNFSVYADYANYQARADDVADKAKLSGFGLGFSTSPYKKFGFYVGLEQLKDGDLDVFQADTGLQYNFANHDKAYALGKIGVGFAKLETDNLSNLVNFGTVPIGIELGYSFVPSASVYVGAGYQWSFDTTSNTTCRDGSQSESTGRGSCSWHGGVAYYNDKIGTVDGATYNIGLRYNF